MNPFQNIDPKIGLLNDTKSFFYGRFRLRFDQVTPFREPLFNRVLIKINPDGVEKVKCIHDQFPQHVQYQVHLYNQGKIRNNKNLTIDHFGDDDWFICLDMTGDVAFITMYNFYFAFLRLCHDLEDCHFYMYSTGDKDTRWIDKYKINDGMLDFSRNQMETKPYWGSIIYYLKETVKHNTFEFKQFAAFLLYNCLFGDAYSYRELRKDGKFYDEFGEEIRDDVESYIQMMDVQERNSIEGALKVLFNLELDQNLKGELNKLFAFDKLDHK